MVTVSPPVGIQSESQRAPVLFLTTVFTINLLAFLNFSSVFVAMVQLGQELKAPENMTLQLPTALYAAIACAAPATAFLLERMGARRLLISCILGLSATTVLASLCQTFDQLMIVLFVHGLFCAPISPATQAAVKQRLSKAQLGTGMAVWGAGNYAGGLIGPLIAGTVLTVFGWRALFLIPLPFVLIALPLVLTSLAKRARNYPRPDAASLLIAPLAMLLVVATASIGPSLKWFESPFVIACIVAIAVLIPLFVWTYRRTRDPWFHLGCLTNRDAGLALLIVFLFNVVSTGLFQVEFLGKDPHMSAEIFGLRTAIGASTTLLGFALAGWLCRSQRYAVCFFGAMICNLIAKIGFLTYGVETSAFQAIWPVAIGGVGFGGLTGLLATLAYRSLSENHAAHVATGFILATYLGSSLGAGVLDEVYLLFDTYFVASDMRVETADLEAFKSEFWVELVVLFLLVIPGLMLLRNKLRDNGRETGETADA